MLKKIEELVDLAKKKGVRRVVVPAANDEEVLLAVAEAVKHGLVKPILIGDRKEIETLAREHAVDLSAAEIVHEPDNDKAAKLAVAKINAGEADVIMKGILGTANYMRPILNKETGIKKAKVLSHVALFNAPRFDRVMAVTDVALNIAPTLDEKVAILENAVSVMNAVGFEKPKVAMLAAVETVKSDMQATVDAACLTKMCERGQIKNCIVDGPLALDNALSVEAAKIKKIVSPVAGHADLLFAPEIVSGNVIYKGLVHFSAVEMAAVIVGAKCPVVLTSRADSHMSKFYSIALACAL